jgi:excisionase family DNA binding protein
MEAYLTIREVSVIVKLSVQTIRRYGMKGEIPFHKIYRAVRFKPSEIKWWVENRKALAEMNRNEKPDCWPFEEVPLEEADKTGAFDDNYCGDEA